MAKSNRLNRSLKKSGEAQLSTEKQAEDKFAKTESIAKGKQDRTSSISLPAGRLSPQLSCTILPDDKQLLNEIIVHGVIKTGKPINTSEVIRKLIHLGKRRIDEVF